MANAEEPIAWLTRHLAEAFRISQLPADEFKTARDAYYAATAEENAREAEAEARKREAARRAAEE